MFKVKRVFCIFVAVAALICSIANVSYAVDYEKESTTSLRMKNLIEKYETLTNKDIAQHADKYLDINGHFGKEYIARLSALNIIAGYGNGYFGPNDTLLACQYIKMVVTALGFTPEIPSGQNYWIPFVDIALNEGLVKNNEIKDYTKPLTRELAATIAFRALMKFEEYPKDDWFAYNLSKISDYNMISDEYKNDVVMAYRMGLVVGSNNMFTPKGTLTRAQAAVIVNKLIDKRLRVESVPRDDEIIKFVKPDYNESLFYDGINHPNMEVDVFPGFFPLNELYDVFKTLNNKKDVAKAYVVNDVDLKTLFISSYAYVDKKTADKFYFEDSRLPTGFASFQAHTYKVYIKPGNPDSLNDKSVGYLYSINTQDPYNYSIMFKPLIHEVLKTLFENEAAEAIKLHDYYLNLALNNKPGEIKTYFLNNRQVVIRGGGGPLGGGIRMEIWAKNVIK